MYKSYFRELPNHDNYGVIRIWRFSLWAAFIEDIVVNNLYLESYAIVLIYVFATVSMEFMLKKGGS